MERKFQFEIGDKVNEYEISDYLGYGGMADVYLAQNPVGVPFALKIMRYEDPQIEERWKREAKSLFSIRHRNIVGIYSVGKVDEKPFLVMEYVPGTTLARRMRDLPALSITEGLKIASGIARGLAEIHKEGMIHRDLKPSNVLLENGRIPKIADFGIVTIENAPELTSPGEIMGTAGFIAPERFEGMDLPASDVYCLGVIVYKLVSGQNFDQRADTIRNYIEMVEQLKTYRPQPLTEIIGDDYANLEKVVDALTDVNPDNRPSAAEAAFDLETLCGTLNGNEKTNFIPRTGVLQSEAVLRLQKDACNEELSSMDFVAAKGPVILLAPWAYETLTGKPVKKKFYEDCESEDFPVLTTHQKFRKQRGLTIGRGADVELRLENESVSRRHARIVYARPNTFEFSLRDCGSANGTYINGVRISHLARIFHGNVLGFSPEVAYVFTTSPVLREEIRERVTKSKIDFSDPGADMHYTGDTTKPTRINPRTTKKSRRELSDSA